MSGEWGRSGCRSQARSQARSSPRMRRRPRSVQYVCKERDWTKELAPHIDSTALSPPFAGRTFDMNSDQRMVQINFQVIYCRPARRTDDERKRCPVCPEAAEEKQESEWK